MLAFENRLRKMYKHYRKWARRQGITCYRIYDADVPEYPLAIEIYEDALHVAEYQRDHGLTEEAYEEWWKGCLQVMEKVLELPAERIFTKQRKPQKGKEQYEKVDTRQHERIVQEGGLKFIVNLSDYLDTGLFLDHRPNRELVRTQAKDKRVLNLFAYTGSFTVYAAAGGAASTLTIDLSNTYLDWAQRNLELNGLEGPQHRFLRADVLQWLEQPVRETYDIIILDPPTFSNSKAMPDVLDVQRDHPGMIRACARRLAPGGVLYFSTNFRKFKMEVEELEGFEVKDITAQSIPNDFRNSRIHYCWEITRSL
jgi:23S rRNA (cytosine1962-C5)-methyltransferase